MDMDERHPLLANVERGGRKAHRKSLGETELNCHVGVGEVAGQKLVVFDPQGDAENPMDWSRKYKLGIVSLLGLMAFVVSFTCLGVVPVADKIVHDLSGRTDKTSSILLVTVWELGEAAGPLLMAPLSEIYGRYPVFNIANIVFILSVILGALSQSTELFIFSRFLTGFAVASNVLNPAIIGDIYPSEQRGSGMSLVMLAPLIGGTFGPAIGGAMAETLGWRNILWMCAACAILCEIAFFTLLRETYKVKILRRRAAALRISQKDQSLKCAFDAQSGRKELWWPVLRTAVLRPVLVMWDSSVLKIMSFYAGFTFTFYYIMATTLPGMLRDMYGFSDAAAGSAFMFFSVGAMCGILVCNLFLDRIYIALSIRSSSKDTADLKDPDSPPTTNTTPEFRLPLMIVAATLFPLVNFLYGWVPASGWPAWALLLSVGLFGFVLIVMSAPSSSYIVDAFGMYSASAMTMVLLTRCTMGTLLPLTIPVLTDMLGLRGAFTLLAAVCVVMVPLPVVVMRYGGVWRQKSKYTRDE
ncbi:uncharacterized protein L3040_000137 [Drepanopeziza brunnea f. sp. 'multigermtubi']|uniref:uncharacterized protein n=1 Tax=Drepanopeziza brunnea f. sp. 'multigermtubi' TaxID=698441 RepID=UPI002389A45C|nr:hypothetical protein L3040_000137 [Drepanopeziza brunnea f. sp. 'multigermtubi']